jgi:hypothetical protein
MQNLRSGTSYSSTLWVIQNLLPNAQRSLVEALNDAGRPIDLDHLPNASVKQ